MRLVKKKFVVNDELKTIRKSQTKLQYYNKLFTKGQISRLVQIESICRRQKNYDSDTEICVWKIRKHCGKRRKCWLSHNFEHSP